MRLSGEVLSNHGTLNIQTGLSCIGAAAKRVVEMYLQDADGKPQKRGRADRRCRSRRIAARGVPSPRTRTGHASGLSANRRPGRAAGRRLAILHRGGEAGVAIAGGCAEAGAKTTPRFSPRRWRRPWSASRARRGSIATSAIWRNWPSGRWPIMPPCACSIRRRSSRPRGRNWPSSPRKGMAWRYFWAETPCRRFVQRIAGTGLAARQIDAAGAAARGRVVAGPARFPASDSRRVSRLGRARSLGRPFPSSAIGNSIEHAEGRRA